jgi:hypothetical protein
VSDRDSVERLIELAEREGLTDAEGLRRLVAVLRDRARLILDGGMRELEDRVAALEREARWRQSNEENLTAELRWREGVMKAQEKELGWRRETEEALQRDVAALRDLQLRGAEAHETLLAHHRAVLSRAAEVLETSARDLPWSYRRARQRLRDLAAALRGEGG